MTQSQRHTVCVPLCAISQAVVVDRTMYISGQLGLDVSSGQLVDGGVQAQTKQVSPSDNPLGPNLVLLGDEVQ